MELPEESLILDLCPWSAIPGHASLRRQLLSRAGVEVLTLPALGSAVEHANEVAKALISFRPSAFAHLVAQMGKELPHVKLGLSHRPAAPITEGRGVRTPLAAMPVRVSVVKIDTQEKLTVE
eukprot:g13241.t1